ncbi:MAG: hypothetical protein BSOLF_2542 [Candidatus Carbobacillus altaicus]|uniref:Uncharacterized protein n=1 Tax=Candidatus Carbonibacillus altaicus TaxID=2163959 RepID=A0A2R6Y2E8_9BACL|nr:MAG: hypothetical protein BSOLF_2542 [Candidatus Carbobacillus altaicus]
MFLIDFTTSSRRMSVIAAIRTVKGHTNPIIHKIRFVDGRFGE